MYVCVYVCVRVCVCAFAIISHNEQQFIPKKKTKKTVAQSEIYSIKNQSTNQLTCNASEFTDPT